MRQLAAVFVAVTGFSLVHADQLPRVLVVQDRVARIDGVDLNLDVADYLAWEIDNSGLLAPIVWSMTDPTFRDAALNGGLKNVSDKPTLKDAFAGSDLLHASYVISVKVVSGLDTYKGVIHLYRNRREVWKHEQSLNVQAGATRSEADSARSLARLWVAMIGDGPLKGAKRQPKITSPEPSPGQGPPKVTVTDPQPKPTAGVTDNTQLQHDIDACIAGGRRNEAILRLRDAVDQEPLDLKRRLMLIGVLAVSDPLAAANEARRVAELMPDHPELRVLAARSWMRAGKTAEAREDLNEAIVRDPQGASTRLLLAEISLRDGRPDQAIEILDPVIKSGASGEARFLRALSRSLIGGVDGARNDLDEFQKLEPEQSPDDVSRRYVLAVTVMDKAVVTAFESENVFLRHAAVTPKAKDVADEGDLLIRQAQARDKFLGWLSAPITHRPSHERRLLAYKLLVQSLSDGMRYLTAAEDDSMMDARLNLGEAIKHNTAAAEAFAKEDSTN